jgi:hypothetical protein
MVDVAGAGVADILFTKPPELIVATAVFVLLQLPPGLVVDNKEVDPIHTLVLPVMALGRAFTVMSLVLWQPMPCV